LSKAQFQQIPSAAVILKDFSLEGPGACDTITRALQTRSSPDASQAQHDASQKDDGYKFSHTQVFE
jgi:hypothetical protein